MTYCLKYTAINRPCKVTLLGQFAQKKHGCNGAVVSKLDRQSRDAWFDSQLS